MKKYFSCATFAAAGVFFALSASSASAEKLDITKGCTLYADKEWVGDMKDVYAGRDIQQFGRWWNNQISSVYCSRGCVATLYDYGSYKGRNQKHSVTFALGFFNDRTSSVKVTCDESTGN